MLSYNVAGLLRESPGTVRTFPVDVPKTDLAIAEDVELARPIEGEMRLSRTGRGILAKGRLATALAETCSRCLNPVETPIAVDIEQEALPSIDIDTGKPISLVGEPDAIQLDDHHELDLAPAVRDAIALAEPIAPLCRPDCRGLCLVCGDDLNADPAHHHDEDEIDPRLAGLAGLLEQLK
ncbi:MAG: hypothetical protein QOH61_474 [Chloroflexota bacterium]|jgi:uncharacterized protein|nr:hypothetical protein [Chloroflexota bacterium]